MHRYATVLKGYGFPILRPHQPGKGKAAQRGVALVLALLTLTLVTAISLAMVISFSSQTLIGGYYRNFRGAFYAADSGLNIARQQVMAQIVPSVPATFTLPATGPTATACGTVGSVTVGTTYAALTALNTGTASNSWNEKFKITNAQILTPQAEPSGTNAYKCSIGYAITSVGTASGSEQQTVTETGNVTFSVSGASATTNVSFAYFGAFVDIYPPGIGPLVPGTMTGPMFTNNAWEFMANQPPWTAPYIFTDPVGQVMSQVDYWDTGWGQHWVAGPSYGSGANLIAPTFQQGLQLNQPAVLLPTNGFVQEEAVVDGKGNVGGWSATDATTGLPSLTKVTNSAVNWSSSTTSGIFANQSTSATTCGTTPTPCIAGGGFYIEGGADVKLVPVGARVQQYVITQGGVTTTISVDPGAPATGLTLAIPPTTTIVSGSNTTVLNGVPENTINPASPQAQTMVYVDGTMTFHGPGEGIGAIQDNAMITLTANGDVIATGDVIYKTEPVTIPQDTLIPAAANMNQVLGIFTANGNFITQDTQADQNIEIDGTIATISAAESANNCASGKGGQLSYGHINTINNVGGMAQSCIYAADVNAENTWFDRRFTARPNFAPPWFPSTTITSGGALPTNTTAPRAQRVQWLSTSSQ
jgi:Tfp pilus assembly protein PilX